MDTQSRIKTNICHCPKTEGGFRGEGRALEPSRRGLKNGQMHQNVFSLPLPGPGTLVYWRRETSPSVSLAMNHGTRSIRTPLFFPFLISGWTERNASYLAATIHTHPWGWARLELGQSGNERRRTCPQNKPKSRSIKGNHRIWTTLLIKQTFWVNLDVLQN